MDGLIELMHDPDKYVIEVGNLVCERCGMESDSPVVGDWYIEKFEHNGMWDKRLICWDCRCFNYPPFVTLGEL